MSKPVRTADDGSVDLAGDIVPYHVQLRLMSRNRSLPKRDRTRLQLLAAAAQRLQDGNPTALTVEKILDEAVLSRGTFYLYFNDIDALLFTLLKDFRLSVWSTHAHPISTTDPKARLYHANRFYVRMYEVNAQLFSAAVHYSAKNAELAEVTSQLNERYTSTVTRVWLARYRGDLVTQDESSLFGIVRILIAASDETLRARFVFKDKALCTAYPTAMQLADGLSFLWCRSLLRCPD